MYRRGAEKVGSCAFGFRPAAAAGCPVCRISRAKRNMAILYKRNTKKPKIELPK